MKTEEGKSMEKAAQEYAENKCQNVQDETVRRLSVMLSKNDFIAGWQEREPEIERLKGLIEKAYTDSNSLQSWERFKAENNI